MCVKLSSYAFVALPPKAQRSSQSPSAINTCALDFSLGCPAWSCPSLASPFDARSGALFSGIHADTAATALSIPRVTYICRVDLIDAPRRRRIAMDPAKLAALRDDAARKAGEEAPRGPFDSGKGVRIQVGRY